MTRFPIGMSMMKNLTLQMSNCSHRKYLPKLIEIVAQGKVRPTQVLTKTEPITDAISAYKAFDKREAGWAKVELKLRSMPMQRNHLTSLFCNRSPHRNEFWRRKGLSMIRETITQETQHRPIL
jgi:hypothetical protein